MSRASFVALLERSERLWEVPADKDLFVYKPGGKVHVSLIYDKRQADADELAVKEALVTRLRLSVARQRSAIRTRVEGLNTQAARLKIRIDYWNARGGAPPDTYVALQSENAAVQRLNSEVNAQIRRENLSVTHLNELVRARNLLAEKANNDGREGGQAQLGGTEISIFVLTGTAKDDVLIAHEFGHILGIKHIPGTDNIMNPVLVKALTRASPADLDGLKTACSSR
jgi:hypothetical protein